MNLQHDWNLRLTNLRKSTCESGLPQILPIPNFSILLKYFLRISLGERYLIFRPLYPRVHQILRRVLTTPPRVDKSVAVQVPCGSAQCNGVMAGRVGGGLGLFSGGDGCSARFRVFPLAVFFVSSRISDHCIVSHWTLFAYVPDLGLLLRRPPQGTPLSPIILSIYFITHIYLNW